MRIDSGDGIKYLRNIGVSFSPEEIKDILIRNIYFNSDISDTGTKVIDTLVELGFKLDTILHDNFLIHIPIVNPHRIFKVIDSNPRKYLNNINMREIILCKNFDLLDRCINLGFDLKSNYQSILNSIPGWGRDSMSISLVMRYPYLTKK